STSQCNLKHCTTRVFLNPAPFSQIHFFFTSESPFVLSVDQSQYTPRLIFFQSIGPILIRNVLVTNGAQKPINCSGSHAGRTRVRSSRVGPSVHHSVAYFHAGGIGIENDPTHLFLQNREQPGQQ